MKNHFLITAVLGLALAGCGVTESVGKGIGNMMTQALVCVTASSLTVTTEKMDLYIVQEDLTRLQNEIRAKKISKPTDIWRKLSQQDVSDLHVWVKEGFEKISEEGSTPKMGLKDYEDMLAQGLISATQKNLPAGSYNFSRVLIKKSGTTTSASEAYRIRLKVHGAPNEESQSFSECVNK
ncbi:MAG: hypothetical protein J7501_11850 [Bdellovibrio sp.]|nr:hypothetical protein [Bdellovibrio sp.]